MLTNQLRIIGGHWRGRKLKFPSIDGLRPTADSLRETLFNWLRGNIINANCLDLFSGSGALGFEALSRGAEAVTFIDSANKVVSQLVENVKLLDTKNATIKQADGLKFLAQCDQQFDIIFLDPPFKERILVECLALIYTNKLLTSEGVIYLEHAKKDKVILDEQIWQILKTKKQGQVQAELISLIK